MTTLQQDLASLRLLCFQIEAGLSCFETNSLDPITSEQVVRDDLYRIRDAIDRVTSYADEKGIKYSYQTPLNTGLIEVKKS